MLSPENLAGVPNLTPEQVTAIVDLSSKAAVPFEKKVAGEATSKAYTAIDDAIKTATGKEKPGGVFTSDHLKSVLTDLKGKSEGDKELATKYADLQAKHKALQDEKASPADASRVTDLEKSLTAAEGKVKALQDKYTTDFESWKTKNDEALKANDEIRAAAVIDRDLEGFTYRDDLDKETVQIVRETTRQRLMEMPRQWVKGEDGKDRLIFLGKDGLPVNDPKTVTPATAGFLATKTLAGITVQGKQSAGTGSGASGQPATGNPSGFSLEGSSSKPAATRKLSQFITNEKKLSPGTKEWQTEFDKVYDETIAKSDLPMNEPIGA